MNGNEAATGAACPDSIRAAPALRPETAGARLPAITRQISQDFDAYLFDMDGTIYLGPGVLPGVLELLAAIDSAGRRKAYVTNNPTRTREEYADKLRGLGIPAVADDVITSAVLTAAWISEHLPEAVVFPVGEPPLHEEFRRRGIRLSDDPAEITLVVSSYDRTFAYWKLQVAFDALRDRPECRFIATHPDMYCPFPGGRGEPDAAAITAAIEACTSRQCELVIGKPSPVMLETALDLLGVPVDRAVMVGDRIRTDIAMGIAAGTKTALVLTGDTAYEQLADWPAEALPDYVLERIDVLAQPLLGKGMDPATNAQDDGRAGRTGVGCCTPDPATSAQDDVVPPHRHSARSEAESQNPSESLP